MTLIIGIICANGIVLAADSQTTKGAAKQLSTNKISVVEFETGMALVAESGSASLSNAAIEIFQRKAKGKQIKDETTVAKTAEESVREVVRGITIHLNPNSSDTERQDFLFQEANYFELMVAYYFEYGPCLYKLNPAWCIPVKATSYFMTSGIASDLANYILEEHTAPKMDSDFASVIAIKTVEDAIKYVEGCGSPPRVAIIPFPLLFPNPFFGSTDDICPFVIFPQKKVEEIAKIIASVEQRTKNTQNKKIHQALRRQTQIPIEEILHFHGKNKSK